MALTLTTDERTELERRLRVILMLADGESYSTIEATVPCYRDVRTEPAAVAQPMPELPQPASTSPGMSDRRTARSAQQ